MKGHTYELRNICSLPDVWKDGISDAWVQKEVSKGYRGEFSSLNPFPLVNLFWPFCAAVQLSIPTCCLLRAFLDQDVTPVVIVRGFGFFFFYSNLFSRKKKSKVGISPILELKVLNVFIQTKNFHVESKRSTWPPFEIFLDFVDIKDAFLHVQCFSEPLTFTVVPQNFKVIALPFSLFSATREFTNVLAPVFPLLQA